MNSLLEPRTSGLSPEPADARSGITASAAAAPISRAPTDSAASRLPRKARLVLSMLEHIRYGSVSITLPDGQTRQFGSGEPAAAIRLDDLSVFEAAVSSGDIGFAETFMQGRWHTDSLISVLDVMVANRRALEDAIYGQWWGWIAHRLGHLLNRNTRAGARRNIQAHYDLGNAFYALWLDETMTYSSALFEGDPNRSLAQAQQAKYQRLLNGLKVGEGARLLEVGCGWGGFAELAARQGVDVTGLTLSPSQMQWANARFERAGVGARARAVLRDYRDEQARYDGIVSIEMFEAVGETYWPSYFRMLKGCLAPQGRAAIQTITIDDAFFDRYRKGTDFIQRYIFPGGMLASPSRFQALAEQAGLKVVERFSFGQDYARTLASWRQAFMGKLEQVRAQGFDERFIRMWEFYLAYCEAAFRHENTQVFQYLLAHR
jgi:cyclopropane-fatty-acyl-phospholipid synthase